MHSMYMILFLMSAHVCNVPTGNVSLRIPVVHLPLGNARMVIWVHYTFPTNPHKGLILYAAKRVVFRQNSTLTSAKNVDFSTYSTSPIIL
ncbi:hypothetical protein FKM82_026839 [Ascaphus truei]